MKRLIFLTLSTLCAATFAQVPDYVPTDGLVAWLPLDNGVEDEGPLNNETVNYGSESAVNRFGQQDAARHFAAARIEISNNESLDQFKTISQWSRTSSSARQVSFKQNVYNGALQERVVLTQNFSGSNCHFGIKENCGAAWNYGNQNFEVADGEWHHFVGVIYPQETRLYIDGELFSIVDIASDSETCSGGDLIIGSEWSGVSYGFQGEIDDVAVWNRPLDEEEILGLYLAPPPVLGCTDVTACNFLAEAVIDDGSCHFNCQFCLTGTVWSEELGGCIGDGSGDINLDGCVQLNDLLDLLSAYGNCGAEEVPWQCGDPLEYQGYDYATVQIGEQCWFAENLRAEYYRNGDELLSDLDDSQWSVAMEGATTVYGEYEPCEDFSPGVQACEGNSAFTEFGLLYNWYAVSDPRSVCPSGWSVPAEAAWQSLEQMIGVSVHELDELGLRGTDQGTQLKASSELWTVAGTDDWGFLGLPCGERVSGEGYIHAGNYGLWWTATMNEEGDKAFFRELTFNHTEIYRHNALLNTGMSVRCIKVTE